MKIIYKYTLERPTTKLRLPVASKFLHARFQSGKVSLWFEIDPHVIEEEERLFSVISTNSSFIDGHTYLGTVVSDEGRLAYHIYEH